MKVIIVYAECVNHKALGDYSFAAAIAHDIATILNPTTDVQVVLSSTTYGIEKYQKLYGKQNGDGKIQIKEKSILVAALETLNPITTQVIALIEANPCRRADDDIFVNLISQETHYLAVYGAHQPILKRDDSLADFSARYPRVSDWVDVDSLLFVTAGIGSGRFGLTSLPKASELAPLSEAEQGLLPSKPYGFIYASVTDPSKDYPFIVQAMKLMALSHFAIVGAYSAVPKKILKAYKTDESFLSPHLQKLSIKPYKNLPYHMMRRVAAGSLPKLVVTSGVNTTLEIMQDDKLPFMQISAEFNHNRQFIIAYLLAIKELASGDPCATTPSAAFMIELSELLFEPKPLSSPQMVKAEALLANPMVTEGLVKMNHVLIDRAHARLAPQLLTFLQQEKKPKPMGPLLEKIQQKFSKITDLSYPSLEETLRRAAAKESLYELKMLLASGAISNINTKDVRTHRTALHWAVYFQKKNAVQLLLAHGASVNTEDIQMNTPLHHAISYNNQSITELLLDAGASLDALDGKFCKPMDNASEDLQAFVYEKYPSIKRKQTFELADVRAVRMRRSYSN